MTTGQRIGMVGLSLSIFLTFGGLALGRVLDSFCVSGRVYFYFPDDKNAFIDTVALCNNNQTRTKGRAPSLPQRDGVRDFVECTCPQ